MRNFHPEKEIIVEYDIDKIREMLEIPSSKYTRFYDFETKILKPILKELEESNIYIYFDKIKSNKGKGSKIKGIRLHMVNPFHIEVNRDTNLLLKEYASKVDDFSIAYKNIYSYRKTHNLEETKEFIELNSHSIFNKLNPCL